MSRIDDLKLRLSFAAGNPKDQRLQIEEGEWGWHIYDNHGYLCTATSADDILAVVALQFKSIGGARQALLDSAHLPAGNIEGLRQVPDPNINYTDAQPGRVTPADIPPPPAMSPDAQAAARRLAQRMAGKSRPLPGDGPSNTYEADELGNPGDPNVIANLDPADEASLMNP